jgi:hypothetical protein
MNTKTFKFIKIGAGAIVALSTLVMGAGSALALVDVYGSTNVNVGAGGTTASASTSVSATVGAKLQTRIETGKSRGEQEIDRRITALTALKTRVDGLVRVDSTVKANISSIVDSQIGVLSSLKTKISSDADITTLKADIKSITLSYRIFMVVIPQGHIIATADAINTVVTNFSDINTKLSARITAAQSAGKDTSSLSTMLSDMNAKSADAKVQADASVAHVVNLKPDNGDKTVMAANQSAFASARADIKVARADLETARQDAHKIVSALKAMNLNVTASSTTSVQ